jgi:hypothetical protein
MVAVQIPIGRDIYKLVDLVNKSLVRLLATHPHVMGRCFDATELATGSKVLGIVTKLVPFTNLAGFQAIFPAYTVTAGDSKIALAVAGAIASHAPPQLSVPKSLGCGGTKLVCCGLAAT